MTTYSTIAITLDSYQTEALDKFVADRNTTREDVVIDALKKFVPSVATAKAPPIPDPISQEDESEAG